MGFLRAEYFQLVDGCLRTSGYFCTLGKISSIFNVVETASYLDLRHPGFKCHSLALRLGTSYFSSLNYDLICKMGVKLLPEGVLDELSIVPGP